MKGGTIVIGFRNIRIACWIGLITISYTAALGGEEMPLTPLKQAGFTPLWEENFTNGKLDVMQYKPAHGSLDVYDSYAIPGAFHFGHKNAMGMTEQQINYVRSENEPRARTLECFVAVGGDASNIVWGDLERRLFVRPKRHKDGGHLHLNEPEKPAYVRGPRIIVKNEMGEEEITREIKDFSKNTAPGQWNYYIISEYLDPETNEMITHFALNGETLTFTGLSATPKDASDDVFSMEWNSGLGPDDRWYIRQVRGYEEYIDADRLREISEDYMHECLAAQPPVRELDAIEPEEMAFDWDVNRFLNITAPPAEGLPEDAVTLGYEDFTYRIQSHGEGEELVHDRVWISDNPNPWKRNVLIQFPMMQVLKVEYDTRGVGEAEGWFQSGFKIGAGSGGWLANLSCYPIAIQQGLTEGKKFVFYPDIRAKGLKIDNTVTIENGVPIRKWFVNLESLKVTGIPVE